MTDLSAKVAPEKTNKQLATWFGVGEDIIRQIRAPGATYQDMHDAIQKLKRAVHGR